MLALILCFLWACGDDHPTRPGVDTGTLTGEVTDGSGAPIEGAAIALVYSMGPRKEGDLSGAHGITDFHFSLEDAGTATLDIFDMQGDRVRRFGPTTFEGGSHTFYWTGIDDEKSRLPNGLYSFELTLRTSSTERVERAQVVFMSDDPKIMVQAPQTTTDAEGRYEIALVDLPLNAPLHVTTDGGREWEGEIRRTVEVHCIDPGSTPLRSRSRSVFLEANVDNEVSFTF
jgi:hypothetical protein